MCILGKASVKATNNISANNSQTALHFAASKQNLSTFQLLLASSASTRTKDKRGQLPLHRAAAVGSIPIMKACLEHRSPLNATDMDGYTALHHAIAEGRGDAAGFLIKQGCEVDKRDAGDHLAIELVPDGKVKSFIERIAEEEGVVLSG